MYSPTSYTTFVTVEYLFTICLTARHVSDLQVHPQERPYVRWLFHSHLTYGRTEQHAVFTYQTSSSQFIDAPEDGPVGPKHVELSNIL